MLTKAGVSRSGYAGEKDADRSNTTDQPVWMLLFERRFPEFLTGAMDGRTVSGITTLPTWLRK
ncbi:MAG TPA: hypothetical protein VJO32_09810 [Ktedonobacteraceae bacterium]|nr:hypothetical protein [Ktedonobacteraceae bacterium]